LSVLAVLPAAAQTQTPGAKPPPPKVRARWTNHPRVDIGDLRLDFRARVTADVRHSEAAFDEDELDRTVDLARRRIGVEGQFRNLFDFQIERELGTELADPWRDVYVNYRQFEFAEFRYGKFKLPFSLDENTSSINLDFAYRSLIATHLAPGRDIGGMAHGRVLGRHIGYEFGIFEQDGDNARTRNLERVSGGTTVAWRVSAQPLRHIQSPYTDLHVAFARTSSDVPEGFPALQGDAVLGARMFEADFYVLGARERQGFEFRWRPGPASVKFESIRLTNERLGQGVEVDDLSPYEAKGWYLSGTYAVTGENKADGLTDPKKPLFQGGVGAIELAGRFEKITFGTTAAGGDVSTSPRADRYQGNSNEVVTFGVNWYLNHWVKVQLNFIRETLSDPAQGPLPLQPSYSSRVFRFQFQF
jgi:phosphate-selective porin OprO/OprP